MLLPKDYINTTCQLHTTSNDVLGIGKITLIGENYFIVSKVNDSLPPLSFLSFVKITVRCEKLGVKVCLASVTESSPTELRLSSLVLLSEGERRGYFRTHFYNATSAFASTRVTAELRKLFEMEKTAGKEPGSTAARADRENKILSNIISTEEEIHGIVRNMSLSGMLLECTEFLQVGQYIIVEITTKKGVLPYVLCIKRRFQDELQENPPFQYGCAFHEKNSSKMDIICNLILERQAQILQQMKNKNNE